MKSYFKLLLQNLFFSKYKELSVRASNHKKKNDFYGSKQTEISLVLFLNF